MTTTSNEASVRVDEILDVVVEPGSGDKPMGLPGDKDRPVPFVVTNAGNGTERFKLQFRVSDVGTDNFDPTCDRVFLDDGSGAFEATKDTLYVDGTNDPELTPDQSQLVFVICGVPEGVSNNDLGNVGLEAIAKTLEKTPQSGDGRPGTVYDDPNGDGIDAVVGATGARALGINGLLVAVNFPTLTKSQRVTDNTGGTTPLPGALVTYQIEAAIASGSVSDAVLTDAIPTGTTYEPNSLALSDAAGRFTQLSDGADDDAGHFANNAIEVRIGNLVAGTPRTVRFRVRINQQ